MAVLTTGVVENSRVLGIRPSSTLTIRIRNKDLINAVIQINGFYLSGTEKIEYVLDSVTLAPGAVIDTNHYAQFDAFEFRFITSSDAVEILAWGKNDVGNMTAVYHMHSVEIIPMGVDAKREGSSFPQHRYVANLSSNNVSVIDEKTNTVITTIAVGAHPKGVGVNPVTNRIYVANHGSNNVSVIDGFSNVVIATIMVGLSPEEVNVDSKTNRIYVENRGSNNVSVISGSTHTVIATIDR